MNPELSALRGLHLPAAQGGLQSEVVTSIVLGFLAALLVGAYRLLRARMSASVRRAALAELKRAAALDPENRRVAQARLLRRLVGTLRGQDAASGKGQAWAGTLDQTFATDFFSRGAGSVLVEGLYRRPGSVDATAIDTELARLLGRIRT